MDIEHSITPLAQLRQFGFRHPRRGAWAGQECDTKSALCPVDALREALAREAVLLRQKDALILEQEMLRKEADHRLLNGLQMVVSLLSLQSRVALAPDVAQQLSIAANRVATIERIHRRLHRNDGARTVAFKKYLEEFCSDFSSILTIEEGSEYRILVEGVEIDLPTTIAIPLGFIVNELITNAIKYGQKPIVVSLDVGVGRSCTLEVSNAGPPLPKEFDPAASKGLGMKIVQSFVRKIGGELRFERGAANQGARVVVLFCRDS